MEHLRTAARLAARLLLHERGRLVTAIGGVAFALLLMFVQLDFRNALLDSSLELLRQIDADILVVSKNKRPFLARKQIPRERLYQALSIDGVQSAHPLWLDLVFWKNFENGQERPIRLIAFEPGDPLFLNDEVNRSVDALRRRGTVIVDRRSRRSYGEMALGPAQLERREVEVVGRFPLGSDFESDGNVITSYATFSEVSRRGSAKIELAAVKVEPGAAIHPIVRAMRDALPTDVRVYSKSELIERDLEYWRRGTPLSIILNAGVALGFAVGVVICYQILYTDVLDHMAEFATLKAMGYADAYIRRVVIVEGWVLAVLGFLPAYVFAGGVQRLLGWLTGLPIRPSAGDALLVLGLSVGMCTVAGVLAVRKLAQVDPAELF